MKNTMFKENTMNEEDFRNSAKNGDSGSDDLLVEVFDDEKSFEDLSMYWKDLAERAGATIYMSHEWAQSWWEHFGKNSRRSPYFITIWDSMKLVGLAPFYRGYSSIGNSVVESRLQLIGSGGSPNEQFGFLDDYGISDFLDILVDVEYKEQIAELLTGIIDSGYLDVDVLKFHQVRDDSFIKNYLYPELQKKNIDISAEVTDTCPYIELENYSTFKKFVKDQKSSARRRIRKTSRATGSDGAFVIKEVKSREDLQQATDTLIELHQGRWNRIGFPGVFYDERFIAFFRDLLKDAYDNGWLWFKEAEDEEGVCASRMLLRYNGRYFDYISGFDERRDSSKYRPGIGLLINLIEEAIAGNARTVELLRGEEYYKYDFTDKNFDNWKITVSLRNQQSPLKKATRKLFNLIASGYQRVASETELMEIQYQKGGFIRMISGYVSFRWQSIKMKLED